MVEQHEQSALQMTTIRKLAENYDTFIFDCDGVVW